MHRLGIQHWRWFRISREDRDLVLYLLDPEVSGGDARNLAFEVHQDGRLEMLEVTSVRHERRGWSWVGPRWPRRTEVEFACGQRLVVDHVALVDSSPFYQRSLVRETSRSGGFGVAELVIPGKIDQDLQRWPGGRECTAQTGKRAHIWLPLFSGPQAAVEVKPTTAHTGHWIRTDEVTSWYVLNGACGGCLASSGALGLGG